MYVDAIEFNSWIEEAESFCLSFLGAILRLNNMTNCQSALNKQYKKYYFIFFHISLKLYIYIHIIYIYIFT